jgi:hypothetical protein
MNHVGYDDASIRIITAGIVNRCFGNRGMSELIHYPP